MKSGQIREAALMLEESAARFPGATGVLYRRAGWLRERAGDTGQALLDYRAAIAANSPMESHLARHMAYLSLQLDRERRFAGLPIAQEMGLHALFPEWPPNPPEKHESKEPAATLPVPGGLAALARALGIDEDSLKSPDAAERIFSFILDAVPDTSREQLQNPLRIDAVNHLKHYRALLRHLAREKLIPPDCSPVASCELVFPLEGPDREMLRTKKFLAFFDIRMQAKRNSGGQVNVSLQLKDGSRKQERRRLLQNLGVNLANRRMREMRLTLRNDSLPLILDSEIWLKVIRSNDKEAGLLESLIGKPDAMRLYLALGNCSQATRRSLVAFLQPVELLSLSPALSAAGPLIDYADGVLQVPGRPEAWEALLRAPRSEPGRFSSALFLAPRNSALLLYCSLFAAPDSVRQYFTSSSDRLIRLCELFAASFNSEQALARLRSRLDPARAFRLMKAEGGILSLDIDPRLGQKLFHESGMAPRGGGPAFQLSWDHMAALLRPGKEPELVRSFGIYDALEFWRYLQVNRPRILTDDTIELLAGTQEQSPLFLDLVWDIDPDADLLARYLRTCATLNSPRQPGWNIDRNRSSQTIFFLINSLRRNDRLDRQTANRLLSGSLDAMASAENESVYAQSLARFLREVFLPAIGATDEDGFLRGLAGIEPEKRITFEGQTFRVDLPAYRFQRMREIVGTQRHLPIETLLKLYRSLDLISANSKVPGELSEDLLRPFERLDASGTPARSASTTRPSGEGAEMAKMARKSGDIKAGGPGSRMAAGDLASRLHRELGISLLTLCYAFVGSPQLDSFTFDPDFVRKHRFDDERGGVPGWKPARVESDEALGSYIRGSLAGLEMQLCDLESGQSVQSFGVRAGSEVVPILLFEMRSRRRPAPSDRAREFVALAVRLGREVLSLSSLDAQTMGRIRTSVLSSLPPQRSELLQSLLYRNPAAAVDVLSPSELFLLGRSCLEWWQNPPGNAVGDGDEAGTCPIIGRLRNLLQNPDPADAALFQEEIEQFGVLQRRRTGLSQRTFLSVVPYERLDRSEERSILFERICDLKIRSAELGYAAGLPAFLEELQAELAVRDVLPHVSGVRTSIWKMVLQQIENLEERNVRKWVNELVARGLLLPLETQASR